VIKIAGGIKIDYHALPDGVKNTMLSLFPTSGGRFLWPTAVGAGGGGALGAMFEPERGDKDPLLTRLRNAGIGAGIGALAGAGHGTFRRYGVGPVDYHWHKSDTGRMDLKDISQPTTSLLDKLFGKAVENTGLPLHPGNLRTKDVVDYIKQETGHVPLTRFTR